MDTAAGGVTMRRNGLQYYHRERAPWKPERGQRVRVIGAGSVPEWAAFTAVMTFAICLLIVAVLVF